MKSLIQIIKEAEKNKIAVGHFNISDLVGLKAIFEAALKISKNQNSKVPIIIGVSEGEREFIGTKQAALLIKNLREEYNYPIFINADHTKSLDKIKEAVEAEFDAVMFDASHLPLKENINQTKKVVEYVKNISASHKTEILVEGELGKITGSSVIFKATSKNSLIKKEDLTKPEETAYFIKETGVDLLAPAVGNIHGIVVGNDAASSHLKNPNIINQAQNPNLDIQRIEKIKKLVKIPLVLHGGSGINDKEFLSAIDAGISIIHINTELRLAWREGIQKALKEKPEEIVPYKLLPSAVKEIEKVVEARLKLFNKLLQ